MRGPLKPGNIGPAPSPARIANPLHFNPLSHIMRAQKMSIEAGLSIKAGFASALFLGFVSVLAVVAGFTVVPLAKGREHEDATRRVSAGLLFAVIGGLPLTAAAVTWQPAYLAYCMQAAPVGPAHDLIAHVLAATPIFALCALVGFWAVAAVMLQAVRTEGKTVLEVGRDIKNEVHP